jgi:GTP diphosphokinase / guanosine-3',5'-bis(diphosphate) 3'-diphosphatase
MENNQDIYSQIDAQVSELFHSVENRMSPEEMTQIKAAYALAKEAHKLQKRKTGDPYIIHPIAVARIVGEEFKLGANPICAAFLHDVVEDTPYTIEDIKERFGDDVAFLVRAVTKEKKEHYEMSKQLDNFKQILDSVHYDIRALLVKIADRLHNMRTLESMSADKQMKIAGETDYFYAPLANRLGLYNVKTELENLSLEYRCPQEFAVLKTSIEEDEKENRSRLDAFTAKIGELLASNQITARVYVDYRTPYSIWHKMQASGRDFKHIDYRHIVHIVFPDCAPVTEKNRCLQIYSILTDVFKEKPGAMNNYIDSPKENGYQSLHIKLLSAEGEWEELHISSERMIYNSKMGCISGRTENGVDNWIKKFKNVLQDIAFHQKEDGFIENVVSSFYNDDVLVFTPKGHGVILPKDATALDFAYEIHSKIGDHAQYARINGKLCSIKTVLKRGDCVEIGVNNSVVPKADWLTHVLTYKAKRHLLSALHHQIEAEPYHRCPDCHPLPGDEVVGFVDDDHTVTIHKRDCSTAIALASKQGDSIISVNFAENMNVLYPVSISVKAIDRYHLLSDLVDAITEKLKLSIDGLTTITVDEIVDCTINFAVHSVQELNKIITYINQIESVDEVRRKDIGNLSIK